MPERVFKLQEVEPKSRRSTNQGGSLKANTKAKTNGHKKQPKVGKSPEIVVVQMLKSMSAFTLPVRVNDRHIDAVVDSAADVTIISEELYSSLNRKPKKVKSIHLDTAGKELSMEGFIAEPISIGIGQSIYKGPIYVATIEQDMLLGIDSLKKGKQS